MQRGKKVWSKADLVKVTFRTPLPSHEFYCGSQKVEIWLQFSTPAAFELLWFRNKATYLKYKKTAGALIDYRVGPPKSSFSLVNLSLRTMNYKFSSLHPHIARTLLKFGPMVHYGTAKPASWLKPCTTGGTEKLKWQWAPSFLLFFMQVCTLGLMMYHIHSCFVCFFRFTKHDGTQWTPYLSVWHIIV